MFNRSEKSGDLSEAGVISRQLRKITDKVLGESIPLLPGDFGGLNFDLSTDPDFGLTVGNQYSKELPKLDNPKDIKFF